jgi:hypothetical protein
MSETAKRLDELGVILPKPPAFIADLLGAEGRRARNAAGVSHIPLNALAVVEPVLEIKP